MIFVYPLTKRKKKKAWSRADKIALLVLVHNVGDFMEKTTQYNKQYGIKNGRIFISCLESEEMAIKQKAKEQNKTVSRLIIDSVLSFRLKQPL